MSLVLFYGSIPSSAFYGPHLQRALPLSDGMQRTVYDETNTTCCGSDLSVALELCFRGCFVVHSLVNLKPQAKTCCWQLQFSLVSYAGDNLLLNVFFSVRIFAAPDSLLVPSCAK